VLEYPQAVAALRHAIEPRLLDDPVIIATASAFA
jgi:hypothetical protein